MDLTGNIHRLLLEASRSLKSGVIDPQEFHKLGMVLLSTALLTEDNYFFVLSNTMYTLADALSSFLKVSSMPLSMEYRGKTEALIEEVKSELSHALQEIGEAISSGDKCRALLASSSMLRVSYRVNMLAETLKNVVVVGNQE
ncbi:hypothetical protein [Thermofilum pendens]|uniref:Uncharacterized protein n=1 Tax=Thermofilum pendens (strain DSM 2475 / Hrk 5) TaxID=368408 RepID=A1RW67_THEPD|nr:hypothetical protein [Thermofilum pendens]ABL77447.1 hypothetical protein Tpen_0037 [Thermofilum pendens Hrk 5]